MKYNSNYHKRKSQRLQGYDYSKAGLYFITICTFEGEKFFGEIIDEDIKLNFAGKIAYDEWYNLLDRFENIKLHEFIVMPNHIHGIVEIESDEGVINKARTLENIRSKENYYSKISPKSNTLSLLIRSYKSCVSRNIRTGVINNTQRLKAEKQPYFAWHRNYYDNIIKNKATLIKISGYIKNNPKNWKKDKFFE